MARTCALLVIVAAFCATLTADHAPVADGPCLGSGNRPGSAAPGPGPGTGPANGALSAPAVRLFCYLRDVQGYLVLAGQQEENSCLDCEELRMARITGRLPAIRGFEVGPSAKDPVREATDAWRYRRQIIALTWHFGAPPSNGQNLDDARGRTDVQELLTPGTALHAAYLRELDRTATQLKKLQDAGVPVLWRPYHEMNGRWFWWSAAGPDAYKALWIDMYNYFTYTKGLDNLLWVWSTAEQSASAQDLWYPGDQYVDFTGVDAYSWRGDTSKLSDDYSGQSALSSGKPFALTESDALPDPRSLLDHSIQLTWFLAWHSKWVDTNTPATKRAVYNNPLVVTADRLPALQD